jgi:hypothetical protein
MDSLLTGKKYAEIVSHCTGLEVEMASRNGIHDNGDGAAFFGVFLASMLVVGDYVGVTQLCDRLEVYGVLLPVDGGGSADPMSKNPELWSLRMLGQRLGQGDVGAAYQILNTATFSATIMAVVEDVKRSLLLSNKRAIAAAYTCISVETISKMLNTPPERTLQLVNEWNWHYDASSKSVEPRVEEADKSYDPQASADQINNIAKYISHFEQKNLTVKINNNKSSKYGGKLGGMDFRESMLGDGV